MLHLSHPFNTVLTVIGIPVIGTALMVSVVTAMPLVRIDQAALIARFTYPEGVIEEIELDDDEHRWEVEFTDDTEIEIDANTGEVIKVEYENDQPDPSLNFSITIEETAAIARPLAPNSYIKGIELEAEDGRLVWEVEFANDIEVEIDATTGAVLDVERD
jgi:uncharacterized membrane protein YkoI